MVAAREGSKRKARSAARTWSGEPDPTVGRGTPYRDPGCTGVCVQR